MAMKKEKKTDVPKIPKEEKVEVKEIVKETKEEVKQEVKEYVLTKDVNLSLKKGTIVSEEKYKELCEKGLSGWFE